MSIQMRTRKLTWTHLFSSSIILMCFILAACGGDSQSSSSVSLTMWTWKIAHVPGLKAIAQNFEAKTGIKVKVTAYNPDDVYRTKITTAAQSGDLPDILSYWSSGQWDLASNGLLTDITDKVDSNWQRNFLAGTYTSTSVVTQTVFDACQKDPKCTYKNIKVGHAYSVPYLAGQAMYVYGNKTLLQQAGLDASNPPKTAEDWLDMMKAVKAKTSAAGLVTGAKNPGPLDRWLFRPLLMTSCGVETYDNIFNGKDHFTNPCALRVLNWMQQVATDKLWVPDILQTDIDPADLAFSQGKAAFDVGGTYTLSFLLAQGMKSSDIVSFPVPPLQGSVYNQLLVNAVALIDAGVSKDSQHPAEALQFLKFMTQPDQAALFARTVGDLPAVKISSDPAQVGPVIPGILKGISDNSPFIQSKAQPQNDPQDVLEVGLQQFITGETTPAALAQKVDAANKAAWAAKGGA
jgi:ABC-type glycerol-3-phosphate transport system substrate-binding protein